MADWIEQLETIQRNADFVRACLQAGGKHEHAANLMVDSERLLAADAALQRMADSIVRELEGRRVA